MKRNSIYEFGEFRLDLKEHQLLRNGEPVNLSPKLFELLVVLVRNSGHLVTRQEFMDEVWTGTNVSEKVLHVDIGKLRQALGDGKNGDIYIENIRGKGYRF